MSKKLSNNSYRDSEIFRLRRELNELLNQKRWEECKHDRMIKTYPRYTWFTPHFVAAIHGQKDPWEDTPICYRQCEDCGFKF